MARARYGISVQRLRRMMQGTWRKPGRSRARGRTGNKAPGGSSSASCASSVSRRIVKLGILADIHEHVEELRKCLAVLRAAGADRLVTHGDVCHTGKRIEQTVALLEESGVIGV